MKTASLWTAVAFVAAASLLAACGDEDGPVCGDGVVEGAEACDDGNEVDDDGCTSACALPACGDGIVQAGEECDDGNRVDFDGCTHACRTSRCGDGVLQAGEACDDGNANAHDGCTNACEPATCGDGVVQTSVEACDDGNDVDADGCTTACRPATCGDGIVQAGEECDDGDADDTDACRSDCLEARCGDGIVQAGEACDDGDADDHDACTNACGLAECGDGIVHAGVEGCDDGNEADVDGCTTTCALPTCGDGVVQAGEACDDGNGSNADACLSTCVPASCGDGFVQEGEACDDGDDDDHDGCTNACEQAVCGDGILYAGVEGCDDGDDDDTDGCTSDCQVATCGDGIVQPGEICDDGDLSDIDGCLATCLPATCGDGYVRAGVEACDDGNADDSDGCTTACSLPTCGDGVVQDGEACDDGNGSNTDACLSTCLPAMCGDGFVRAGVEACDDGNASDQDACLSSCEPATCGDGIVWAGVEACDDGDDDDTDGCLSTCAAATCGDGIVQTGETCDDADMDNTDGCLITCEAFDLCGGFEVDAVEPPVACVGAVPQTLTLIAAGRGFLVVDGQEPSVTFDDAPAEVVSLESCAAVPGAFVQAEACGRMVVAVPAPTALSVGDHRVGVENPVTQACAGEAVFSVGPEPSLTGVSPSQICADLPTTITLEGTGLFASTEVRLVSLDTGEALTPTSTAPGDAPGTLTATFDALPAGGYDVVASNGPGCGDVLEAAVQVFPRPVVFFVDPPVVYNDLDLQVTLFVANVQGGAVEEVQVREQGTSAWQTVPHDFDPQQPGRVRATLPAGLVAADQVATFEITLVDGLGCPAALDGSAQLTRSVTVAPFEVRPPFGGVGEATAVSITIDEGAAGAPFLELPRVYLDPAEGAGAAEPLSSVGFIDERRLTALVEPLPEAVYDVIVVNPDGSVGVLAGGFEVTADAPPRIDTIAPGSVPGPGTTVAVFGENFVDPSVELECRDPALPGAEPTQFVSPSVGVTGYGLDFTVPAGIPQDSICLVRTVNTGGTFDEFSALVQLTPSENVPAGTLAAQLLETPRRAPVALVGSVTRTARFLYALGGDAGDPGQALSSVEVAALTPFGDLGPWRTLPAPLPSARTLAGGAAVGRFLYVIGGHDGDGATDSVLRAEVLRPEDAPRIDGDLTIELGDDGLTPGLWYYRVSAVMEGDDPDNPGGETLPSEPLPIQVPPWVPDGFRVTLRWAEVPGAQAYHVYRSPAADASLAGLRRIATLPPGTRELTDTLLPAGEEAPLQLGDLGAWTPLPSLQAPRAALGVTVLPDPVDRDVRHLYAVAGHDDPEAPLAGYEVLTLTVGEDGGQAVAPAWVSPVLGDLPSARSGLVAYGVDATVSGQVALDEAWLYAGPGAGAGTATRFFSAPVLPGGLLGAWQQAFNGSVNASGYGGVAASNQLFVFGGGSGGAPSVARDSGFVLADGFLSNVNATGSALASPRAWPGSTLGSGRIFLVGGVDAAGPLDTIEVSIW